MYMSMINIDRSIFVCPNFTVDLAKPPLKWGHRRVIKMMNVIIYTFYDDVIMWSFYPCYNLDVGSDSFQLGK